jgi:hypothetical protein
MIGSLGLFLVNAILWWTIYNLYKQSKRLKLTETDRTFFEPLMNLMAVFSLGSIVMIYQILS